MASGTVEDRIQKIKNLKYFIKSVEERVQSITDELNWSYEELAENNDSLSTCSIHPHHRVRNSHIKEHEEKCRWREDGYHPQDVPLPEFCGQGSYVAFTPELQEAVVKNVTPGQFRLTGETTVRAIPQVASRFDQDFTREEKLAIYDYVIANTEKQKLYGDLTLLTEKEDKTEKREMTALEIAAAERDAKRRRASYRNKVHTNRKTQTEILREVIESQMESLSEQIIYEKNTKERHLTNEPRHSSKSYSKSEYRYDRPHKYSEYSDRSRHYSDRGTKYKDRYFEDEKRMKIKKHKRSRSRSRSWEKFKYKKSSHYHSQYSYNRIFSS